MSKRRAASLWCTMRGAATFLLEWNGMTSKIKLDADAHSNSPFFPHPYKRMFLVSFGLYNKKSWLFPTRRRRTSSNAPVASSLHPISIIHRFFFQKSSDTSRMGSRNQEISQHSGRPSTTRMLATRKSFKWWRDAGWRIPTSDPISLCWKPRSAVSTSNETPVANGLQCYTTWKRKQRSAQLFIHQFLSVSRIVATAGI